MPDKAKRVKVFLIDDHPLVRESLTNLINQQADMTVCGEAEDSASALKGLAAQIPDVAIIDTDVFVENAKKFGAYCAAHPSISIVNAAEEILGK